MTHDIKCATLAATFFVATSATAMTPVGSVSVDVDLAAIQNERAATYWTDIADDLETALVARLTDQLSEDGASVSIDIDELSIANTFESTFGWEESFLTGDVLIADVNDQSAYENYTLKVSFEQAIVYMPENVDLSTLATDSPHYYQSMIAAFADNVVEKLK